MGSVNPSWCVQVLWFSQMPLVAFTSHKTMNLSGINSLLAGFWACDIMDGFLSLDVEYWIE